MGIGMVEKSSRGARGENVVEERTLELEAGQMGPIWARSTTYIHTYVVIVPYGQVPGSFTRKLTALVALGAEPAG